VSSQAWQATARRTVQTVGLDPRYLRRVRWLHKAAVVRRDHASLRHNLRYVLLDPETDNFTYDLANQGELAAWVAAATGCPRLDARRYMDEPAFDADLQQRLQTATAGHWWWSKRRPRFGKRLAWYALARILKPDLVIETGVHDGLGSLLLLRALERNGPRGRLVSFDINPQAGWLVGSHPQWDLRIQHSQEGLASVLAGPADPGLFVYDGLHTPEAETADLELVLPRMASWGVLVSDDAHNGAMSALCAHHGLEYHEVAEHPLGHFYPGSLLAAAQPAPRRSARA
jgi:hypothetical protein